MFYKLQSINAETEQKQKQINSAFMGNLLMVTDDLYKFKCAISNITKITKY